MGIPLNALNWSLAVVPILALLCGILVLKWSTFKTGGVAWIITAIIAFFFFKTGVRELLYACSKGLSLSLYVLLIIWSAVFLYNIASRAGGIKVIGQTVTRLTGDKVLQCMLLAWCFTSLLQGLAGFGVPIAVVAPIMVTMGFDPLIAVASCLVGHSWAISFGSMGSSYNTIQLVTGIPGEVIGPVMALLFILPIFATGVSVLHISGGAAAIKKGVAPLLAAGALMSVALWAMNIAGVPQLASLVAAVAGVATVVVAARVRRGKAPPALGGEAPQMSFLTAAMPYLLLIGISIVTQIPAVKSAASGLVCGLDYPELVTGLGYVTPAVKLYSKIQWISHPAPALLLSALAGYFIYTRKAGAPKSILKEAAKDTVKKCIPTSVGIITMVMMALVMSDSGMTNLLARGIALVLGGLFPIASPLIGVLGSFMTGSNTNSNIMFGLLQYETALVIGKNAVIVAAAQSVGGSLGVSISPSTIMMGSANVGLTGQESRVMATTLKYCLPIALLLGVIVYLIS